MLQIKCPWFSLGPYFTHSREIEVNKKIGDKKRIPSRTNRGKYTIHLNSQLSTSFIYVDNKRKLQSLLKRFRETKRIALDTEADSLHHYYEKVCLIQLSLNEENYIVDPLAGIDLSEFFANLVLKPLILHGADYDLRMLHKSFGFRPQHEIFDTMLAAQLLGYEQFSLVALVQRFVGVTLTKRGQKSDWSRRPLTREQLQYAIDDTQYLRSVADRLHRELRTLGRVNWFRETCENMVESATINASPRDPDTAWRIKGWSRLDQRELAFLRVLWRWRENEAKKVDLPPFKIFTNQNLLDLVVWMASNPTRSVKSFPKLPRKCGERRFQSLKTAIRQARSTPKSKWPALRQRSSSEYSVRDYKAEVGALQAECARVAVELGITPSVLASRATLEKIVRTLPKNIDEMMACGPMMHWQAGLLAPKILPILTNLRKEQKG